ncbi:MAG: hypothetical protein VB104_04870 [Candidatus Limiplasma sp.]|nr:hypothetical protein [Candidatus Limiplasma sp.]
MADGDGQVVFTVALDDSAFQEGLVNLQAALVALAEGTVAALTLGATQGAAAVTAGGQWIDGFASGIGSNRAASTAAVAAVNAAANAARAPAHSGGYSVGQNLVSGMASGASAMSASLSAAMARIVQTALAAARRAAGISSPSRLFHDEVGRYLALGVQTGFVEAMQADVLPAVGANVRLSAGAARAALGGTLLTAVGAGTGLESALAAAAQSGAAAALPVTAQAAGSAALPRAEGGDTYVTQQITFQTTPQAPDEVARALRRQATYGLAGARAGGTA